MRGYLTDERLKSYLDTNQIAREQMCLAVLSIDRRFSEVRPMAPRGGRDGGRDIEAVYRSGQRTFGAVSFVNQACDSTTQIRGLQRKFKSDVSKALTVEPRPEAFVFFTNINFPLGIKNRLAASAKNSGFKVCEIMDRERLRIALDSPDGFATRFQFLDIPLSEPEQATFFAKWGDEINAVISTGFQRIESKINRLLFLQEASEVLGQLVFQFQLKQKFDAKEVGHFRAYVSIHLKEPKFGIWGILFGATDRANRTSPQRPHSQPLDPPGIQNGIAGAQWEQDLGSIKKKPNKAMQGTPTAKYRYAGSSSSIGLDPVEFINTQYEHDTFIRLKPGLKIIDLHKASFIALLNTALATKLKAIHVYANGYKIQEIADSDFQTSSLNECSVSIQFLTEELRDPWVVIHPSGFASFFEISFNKYTPIRLFDSPPSVDTLAGRRHRPAARRPHG